MRKTCPTLDAEADIAGWAAQRQGDVDLSGLHQLSLAMLETHALHAHSLPKPPPLSTIRCIE